MTEKCLRDLRVEYNLPSENAIRSPLTSLLSVNVHNLNETKCKHFEIHLAECVEAYGFYKGIDQCHTAFHDFRECLIEEKRRSRFEVLCGEFIRQVEAGERNYEKVPFLPFF